MKRSLAFLVLSLALGAASAATALSLDAIPYPLTASGLDGPLKAAPGSVELVATKGTDLFVNGDGSEVADKTPRLLFTPVGDFIFSARVSAGFKREYDGAALIVYGGPKNWAKLLFEQAKSGKAGISSTVAKGVGDDAHHGVVAGSVVYLKVARVKEMIVFYTSPDGATWSMVRNVHLPSATPLQVGFSAQSPVGERFAAQFSDVKFRAAAFKDFWQGE